MIVFAQERIDELNLQDYQIIQPLQGFRFTLDAILLAFLVHLPRRCQALDLGTGTGVIPHILAARGAVHVTGLELNTYMAGLASRSVALNGLQRQILIQQGDVKQFRELLSAGAFDVVVSNPPYLAQGQGKISPNPLVAQACYEGQAKMEDFVAAASFAVKFRGRVAMVHRPEHLPRVMAAFAQFQLEPKRLRFIQARATEKPYLFFMEGVRGARPGLSVLPPFVVYNDQGNYTPELWQFYHSSRRRL